MTPPTISPETIEAVLGDITARYRPHRPRAMVLFGSTVRYLDTPQAAPAPNDLDLLVVGDLLMVTLPPDLAPLPVEIHRFRTAEVVDIARTLRYAPKALALSRLYGSTVMRQHARNIIAASMLLGPTYNDFGIEQIERDGRPDDRDYSRHRVLAGSDWWTRLQAYARQRRTIIQQMADRITGADRF